MPSAGEFICVKQNKMIQKVIWHLFGFYFPWLRVKNYSNYSEVLPCEIWGTNVSTTMLRIENMADLLSGHLYLSVEPVWAPGEREALNTLREKARVIGDKGG